MARKKSEIKEQGRRRQRGGSEKGGGDCKWQRLAASQSCLANVSGGQPPRVTECLLEKTLPRSRALCESPSLSASSALSLCVCVSNLPLAAFNSPFPPSFAKNFLEPLLPGPDNDSGDDDDEDDGGEMISPRTTAATASITIKIAAVTASATASVVRGRTRA